MTYILQPGVGDTEAGIHILIVGVDKYPYLHDKEGVPLEPGFGFGVLDAPSHSCKLLADWFASGHLTHTDLQVKSIDVLASRCIMRAHGARVKAEMPSFENVRQAIERWYKLGHQSKDNLLVFYFCGHGVRHAARSHSLLCADFGSHTLSPFDHAINYEGFESGMRSCAASRQIFLLDTCRTPASELTSQFSGIGADMVSRRAPEDLTCR